MRIIHIMSNIIRPHRRRIRRSAAAAVLCALLAPVAALAADISIRFEGALTHDDNVGRSIESQRLSDESLNFSLAAGWQRLLTERVRFVATGTLGGEKFHRYEGLSRVFAGVSGELQYRPAATFGAPTYALFGRSFIDRYDSDLRDGYRHAFGLSVGAARHRPHRFLGCARAQHQGRASSSVFDTRDYGVRANLDYALTANATLYLGLEYRRGDTVASGLPSLAFVDIAKAIVRDDAFLAQQRFAYRVEARTVLTTIGGNLALSEGHSLDLSWRWIQATPTDSPGFVPIERIRYRVNQFTFAYLARF